MVTCTSDLGCSIGTWVPRVTRLIQSKSVRSACFSEYCQIHKSCQRDVSPSETWRTHQRSNWRTAWNSPQHQCPVAPHSGSCTQLRVSWSRIWEDTGRRCGARICPVCLTAGDTWIAPGRNRKYLLTQYIQKYKSNVQTKLPTVQIIKFH